MKVREGNLETVHYFHTDHQLAEFAKENPDLRIFGEEPVEEAEANGANGAPAEKPAAKSASAGTVTRRRCIHVELHESKAVAELLNKLEKKGLSIDQYRAADKPLFELIEGEGDNQKKRPLFSIPEILDAVKEVGKRGVQITGSRDSVKWTRRSFSSRPWTRRNAACSRSTSQTPWKPRKCSRASWR